MQNFQYKIKKVYDHLYANHTSKTPSVIGDEVGKILNVALFIEEYKNTKPAFDFNQSQAAALLNLDSSGRKEYSEGIRDVFKEMNKVWGLYENDNKISLNDYDICYCCTQLSGVEVSDKNVDVLGDAAEVFRGEWAKRLGGQFFTDAQVTKLAIWLLDFNPYNGDDLVDICAGTGGFLLAGLNHMQYLFETTKGKSISKKELIELSHKSLKGVELDQQVASVARSTLKARLGAIDGEIAIGNSLDIDKFNDKKYFLQENSHKCAATNPPFGTKISIKDPNVLKNFELAVRTRNGKNVIVPTPPDILFLEQNIKMLVPGVGKLAIVLPYQLLSGPQTLYIRKWLLSNVKILAVIDLPIETFQPYTGTKTSLLVVQRKDKNVTSSKLREDYNIFMAVPRWIGHDRRGNPVLKKDGTELLTDFGEIINAFEAFKKGTNPNKIYDACFVTKSSTIMSDPLLRANGKFWKPIMTSQKTQFKTFSEQEWKLIKLKELVKRIFYPGRFKRNYIDHSPFAVPFLGGADISEFITHTTKWLSPDDPKLEELQVHKGWILITRSGTTGTVSSVPEAWEGRAVSEHVIRIVPNDDKIESEYLLAVLQSDYIQKILAKGIYGSVIDEINPDYIGEIEIPIPKSKKKYIEVIQMLKEAEKNRQAGISNYTKALETVNRVLSS